MSIRLPPVEVPHYGDGGSVRGPDAEVGTHLLLVLDNVGAQNPVGPAVSALVEEVKVVGCQQADIVADEGVIHALLLARDPLDLWWSARITPGPPADAVSPQWGGGPRRAGC